MWFLRQYFLWFVVLVVMLCSAWNAHAQTPIWKGPPPNPAPLVVPAPPPVPPIEFAMRNNFLRTALTLNQKGGPIADVALTDTFNLDRSTGFTQLSASLPFRDCRFGYSYDARREFSGSGLPTEFTFSGKTFGQASAGTNGGANDARATTADISLNSHRVDADLPAYPLLGFAVRPSGSWLITNARLNLVSNGTRAYERKTSHLLGVGAAFTTVNPITRIQGRATYWLGEPNGYSADVGASIASSVWWNRLTSVMVGYRVERVNFGLVSGDIRVNAQGPWIGVNILF